MISHPIVPDGSVVKVVGKTENKGEWVPEEQWEELTVDTGDGVLLQFVRHRSSGSPRAFNIEVGDNVAINWVTPKNENKPWYYTSALPSRF